MGNMKSKIAWDFADKWRPVLMQEHRTTQLCDHDKFPEVSPWKFVNCSDSYWQVAPMNQKGPWLALSALIWTDTNGRKWYLWRNQGRGCRWQLAVGYCMCLVAGPPVKSTPLLSRWQELICMIQRRRNGNMWQTCVLVGAILVLGLCSLMTALLQEYTLITCALASHDKLNSYMLRNYALKICFLFFLGLYVGINLILRVSLLLGLKLGCTNIDW